MRDREHPRRDRCAGPAARPAGAAVRVPGVAGDPVAVVLGDGERTELGSVGPPAEDEAGLLEGLGHELALVARSLGGSVGAVGDGPAVNGRQVLYRDRHAGERRKVVAAVRDLVSELARLGAGLVVVAPDHRVQRRVEAVDALQGGVDELERTHLVSRAPPRRRRARRRTDRWFRPCRRLRPPGSSRFLRELERHLGAAGHEHDLAELRAGGEPVVGRRRLRHRERRSDRHDQPARLDEGQHAPLERGYHERAIGERACAHGRRHDARPLRHEGVHLELELRAGTDPDHDETPTGGEARDRVSQTVSADQLEDDVEGAELLRTGPGGRPPAAPSSIRAVLNSRCLVEATTVAPAAAPSWTAQEPDPAGGAGDQEPVPPAPRPAWVNRASNAVAAASMKAPADSRSMSGRDLESGPLVGESQLGLRRPTDERHHPVADLETGRPRPDGDDLACELEPRDVLQGCQAGAGRSPALEQIGPIEPGSPNSHQQLEVARDGVGALRPLEAGIGCDRDGAHAKR